MKKDLLKELVCKGLRQHCWHCQWQQSTSKVLLTSTTALPVLSASFNTTEASKRARTRAHLPTDCVVALIDSGIVRHAYHIRHVKIYVHPCHGHRPVYRLLLSMVTRVQLGQVSHGTQIHFRCLVPDGRRGSVITSRMHHPHVGRMSPPCHFHRGTHSTNCLRTKYPWIHAEISMYVNAV